MDHFVIEGGHRLSGAIRPAGNKNAALPLLAASLLTDEPVTIRNLPDIGDVRTKLALLAHLGVQIEQPEAHVVGYRARIRNHGHSCFLCEIVIRSQFHTTYEPEA
jgi:UDP-N-acetylglucosamine 1-carboxyvinyltransferase (EC 2.5.1.7)